MELDINLEDYYQEIVNKIEKGDQEKMKKTYMEMGNSTNMFNNFYQWNFVFKQSGKS